MDKIKPNEIKPQFLTIDTLFHGVGHLQTMMLSITPEEAVAVLELKAKIIKFTDEAESSGLIKSLALYQVFCTLAEQTERVCNESEKEAR